MPCPLLSVMRKDLSVHRNSFCLYILAVATHHDVELARLEEETALHVIVAEACAH